MVANITASKVVNLWGLFIPAAFFSYSITFLMTDVCSEIWGRERARRMVWLGFGMNLVMIGLVQISVSLPAAPFWSHQEAYSLVLRASFRIVLASMAAYTVSQFVDIWAFLSLKRLTKGRCMWLRNNFSTYLSQAIDTTIFIVIAFGGLVPATALLNMIFSQYLVKVIITIFNTPFFYGFVIWIRGKEIRNAEG